MIGIFYISTGRYHVFWKSFYITCEKYFLPTHKKKYFVFTDAEKLFGQGRSNVIKFYQKNLGWPNNTLLRFDIFLRAEEYFNECDYLFFFNGNIKFLKTINNDILPNDNSDALVAVLHPGFYNKTNENFTYERNKQSTAYIPEGLGSYYFMGGFNGGKTNAYVKLIKTLRQNIHQDLARNIIAIWHDESHLNRYLLDKQPKILSPEYGYPEGLGLPFKAKVLILSKNRYGGNDYLRNITNIKKPKLNGWNTVLKKGLNKIVSMLSMPLKNRR